ncbi:MAG: hypothetical protein AAGH64_03330 [Planctomycetota bacterium]
MLAALTMLIALCAWRASRPGRDGAPRCAACAYDLTSCDPRATAKCPECGVVIAETGIHRRGPNGGSMRRRAWFLAALACAGAMGCLVLLKYPPVMQSVRVVTRRTFTGVHANPHPIVATETDVKHPGYTTNPLVHLVPGMREPSVLERSFVLERTGLAVDGLRLRLGDDAARNLDGWIDGQPDPFTDEDRRMLVGALEDLGFVVGPGATPPDAPMVGLRDDLWFPVTSKTRTSPSTLPPVMVLLGAAPSVGFDLAHTTWLQVSNIVWYALPSVGTVVLFWWAGRRSRRRAIASARVWIGDA